ncbi:Uncharacterized membrane protein YckC, RDD family [Pustulibacterium marinum]|uniref:Uncharacterized membrane protein YckC, RDD family n=1 Tax=Pustulibacterium marinum TaxID=1224947 RepID=A0A1I7H418_9FLAO|nr:RDD family protein [Pustulibacterium marinum]SFU55413.1 Uncharacterized membrane protein YckC, RDD family [Pustulibacterium marinum]
MTNLAINTAQNVNIAYKTVGLGERIVAFLIDGIILLTYLGIIESIMEISNIFSSDRWTEIGFYSLFALPALTYSLYCNILFDGRTVGKIIMKIKVVREDGKPTAWNHYLVRWLLRFIDIWMFFSAIGVLSIMFSDKKQRVGDAAAGTIVISTKNSQKISSTILEELDEDYTPVFSSVIQLTDKDVNIIKEVYQIAIKSADFRTLSMLRAKVSETIQTNSELYDKQFIETVLKDYNYYTQQM